MKRIKQIILVCLFCIIYITSYAQVPSQPGPISISGSYNGSIICYDTYITCSITPVSGATKYEWTDFEGYVYEGGTTFEPNTMPSVSGNVTITVRAGNASGYSAPRMIAMSLLSFPNIGFDQVQNSYCKGQQVTLKTTASPSAIAYIWSYNGVNLSSSANQCTYTFQQSGQLTVLASGYCGDYTISQNIIVNTTSAVANVNPVFTGTSGDVVLCSGTTQLNINAIGGATYYKWFKDGTLVQNSASTSLTVSTGGTYSVRAGDGCGESNISYKNVISQLATPGAIQSSIGGSICYDTQVTYSISPIANATGYKWTDFDGNVVNGGTSFTTYTMFDGTKPISVKAINGCLTSSASSLNVNITPQVTDISFSPAVKSQYCKGEVATFALAGGTNAINYTWKYLGQTIPSSDQSRSVTIALPQAGVLEVQANGYCNNPATQATINVLNDPGITSRMPTLQGDNTIVLCPASMTLTVNPVTNANYYVWFKDGVQVQNSASTSLVINAAGTYSVKGGNVCGLSLAATTTVLSQMPSPGPIQSTLSGTFCAGVPVTYSISPVIGATGYTWTDFEGGTSNGSASFTTYTIDGTKPISVKAYNSCSTTSPSTLSVSVTPSVTAISFSPVVKSQYCANEVATFTLAGGTNAINYTWKYLGQPIPSSDQSRSVTIALPQAGVLEVQANGYCNNPQTQATVTVLAYPSAPTSVAGSGATISQITANWNSVSGATGYYMDVATDNGFANMLASYNNVNVSNVTTYTVTGLAPGTTYYYRVRAYNGSCAGANSSTITYATIPAAPTANAGSGATISQIAANWAVATGSTGYYLDVSTNSAFSSFVTGFTNFNVTNVTTYLVTGLTAGTTYYYRVRAYNASGTSSNSSTITYATIPAAPTATAGTGSTASQITANWSAPTGATGYYLDVSTNSAFSSFVTGFNNVSVGNVTTYNVPGLTVSTTYYYRLRAFNGSGASANSTTITYATLPSAPTANAGTGATINQITANWSAVSSATGYYLDVSTNSAFSSFVTGFSNKDVSNATTFNVTGLSSGTTYYYRVRAYNSGGTSGNSSTITYATIPLAPTANAGTGATSSQITANWSAITGATGYYLDVSTNSAFSSFVTGFNNFNVNNVTTYLVTGLTAGTTYYYRVRAYNASGASSNSSTITYATIPAAPTATAGTGSTASQITANWSAPTGATGYYLDVSTNSAFSSFVTGFNNVSVGNVTTYNVPGLIVSTTYYYRVRAYNGSGTSSNSSTITYATLPSTPTANAGTGATSIQITANWSVVSSATGYSLDVSTNSSFSSFVTGYSNKDVSNVTTYPITGLSGGITYYYRVRAYNSGGTSGNSSTITYATVPAAPTANAGSGATISQIAVNWAAATGATGYYLDVSTNSAFSSFVTGFTNFNVNNVTTYLVTGLTAGTTYYYRVRAYNASGTSSNSSTITYATIPVAPTATAGTGSTASQITANWSASTGATGYYLDVSTNSAFSSFVTNYNNKNVGNVTTCPITGLTISTTYYYRLRAFNGSGTSANSSTITYATIPSAPTANAGTGATINQITANWSAVSSATGYYLDVSTNSAFSSFVTGFSNKDVSNVTTFNVTGLSSGTTYYYRVRVYNSGGTSGNSSTITYATIPSAPTANAGTGATSSQITANWNAITGATGYYLDVSTNSAFSSFVTGFNNVSVGNVTTYNVPGLTVSTTYYYRLRAFNGSGASANSTTITYATLPSAPTPNAGTGATINQITANWSAVSSATGYYLDVSTNSAFSSFVTGYSNKNVSNVTTANVTGLAVGTTYYYRVRAYNSGGTSGNSSTITYATIPSAPTANAGTGVSIDQITANWSAVSGATGYYLDVSINSAFSSFVSGYNNKNVSNVTISNVTGLAISTTYYYRVRAYNGSGASANSATITCITLAGLIGLYQSNSQLNSVETITFDSPGNVTGQSIAYSDLLGRGVQSQSRNITQNSIMVGQTIYDGLGRAAISTLAAPTSKQNMDYVTDFVTNPAGVEYNYSNFEKASIDALSGQLANYYSASNTLEPYTPASAYPYSRVEFSKLSPGVARKSAAAGEYHRLGSGQESQTYTMTVPENELYDFSIQFTGLVDVKLETKGITKSIGMDADHNTSIVYTSASGQQISACYADASAPAQSVTFPITTENQYCDIHMNVADNVTLSLGTCNVYNLADDSKSSTVFSGTKNLPAGFYRFEYIGVPAANTTLTYKIYYKGHSFNFYDNAGRSVFGLSPKGHVDWKAETTKNFSNMKKYASYNEYNSLGWLLSSSSPDEGLSTFKYAADGKIRFSQNAQQLIYGKFSYTNYDNANRSVESGECTGTFASADVASDITAGTAQWTKTVYDDPADSKSYNSSTQNYTTGKVSKTYNANSATWYSYTYDGKVEWVVQNIVGLGTADKTIEYTYDDNITGRVSSVIYQRGQTDEFTHHYTYDADGRLEYVYTKKQGDAAEKLQAHYLYYAHGPLKRVELAGNLQGTDYVYNINGWLKSINHPDLTANDPGGDGYTGNTHSAFKPDVFSMGFDYYSGDYASRAAVNMNVVQAAPKYNGNIAGSRWGTRTNNTTGTQSGAFQYTYDNRGFLTLANFGTIANSTFTATGAYNEAITGYDLNGNILGLTRYASQRIDALTYNYLGKATNQLRSVTDAESQTAITTDIKTQPGKNYLYNAIGQQYWNESEKQYFTYDVYGHVTGIYADSAKTTPKALYTYNDKGFRIKKVAGTNTTWYVRDDAGSILATYTGTTPILSEVNLYGSSRIGEAQANNTTGVIEKYVYELTDHIGNVRATISANTSGGYDVLSYTDYYPFGMEIPGRGLTPSTAYGFGYQGQYAEKDNETTSGYNHFEARDYDSRLGRWLIPDPAGQYHSPYLAMGNNPVSGVDPDGMYSWKWQATIANFFHGGNGVDYDHVKEEWYYSKGVNSSFVMPVFTGGLNKYANAFVNNLGKDFHENVQNNWNYIIDHPLNAVNNLCNNILTTASSVLYQQTYIDMYYDIKKYIQAPAEVKGMIDAQALNGVIESGYTIAPIVALVPELTARVKPLRGEGGIINGMSISNEGYGAVTRFDIHPLGRASKKSNSMPSWTNGKTLPHYHRGRGNNIRRHRPWEKGWNDESFFDRF